MRRADWQGVRVGQPFPETVPEWEVQCGGVMRDGSRCARAVKPEHVEHVAVDGRGTITRVELGVLARQARAGDYYVSPANVHAAPEYGVTADAKVGVGTTVLDVEYRDGGRGQREFPNNVIVSLIRGGRS